jgi:hypothetical protein
MLPAAATWAMRAVGRHERLIIRYETGLFDLELHLAIVG